MPYLPQNANMHSKRPLTLYLIYSIFVFILLSALAINLLRAKNNTLNTTVTETIPVSPADEITVHKSLTNKNVGIFLEQKMKICASMGTSHACYKNLANELSASFSLKDNLAIIAKNEDIPQIYNRCHELTHYLGRNEYQKTKNISASYVSCNSTCQGGCYHGVTEEYLHEKNLSIDSSQFETSIKEMCGKSADYQRPYIYFECLHGTGHAAMFITDNNLFQSLQICDLLQNKSYEDTCYSGVFMENSSSSTGTDHPSKFIKAEDPLYPCNALEQKYQQVCYRYQSSYFAILTHQDWKKTSELCLKTPRQYQKDCFSTIGSSQVGFTQDKKIMNASCMSVPTEFQQICIESVITSMATRFVDDLMRLNSFCSLVSKEYQSACYQTVKTATGSWKISNFVAK